MLICLVKLFASIFLSFLLFLCYYFFSTIFVNKDELRLDLLTVHPFSNKPKIAMT